jgi:hypothetical protein
MTTITLPPATGQPTDGETLFDFLSGYIGTVSGTTEASSENCGQRWKSFRKPTATATT